MAQQEGGAPCRRGIAGTAPHPSKKLLYRSTTLFCPSRCPEATATAASDEAGDDRSVGMGGSEPQVSSPGGPRAAQQCTPSTHKPSEVVAGGQGRRFVALAPSSHHNPLKRTMQALKLQRKYPNFSQEEMMALCSQFECVHPRHRLAVPTSTRSRLHGPAERCEDYRADVEGLTGVLQRWAAHGEAALRWTALFSSTASCRVRWNGRADRGKEDGLADSAADDRVDRTAGLRKRRSDGPPRLERVRTTLSQICAIQDTES